MSPKVLLGIDVACSKKKRLPLCFAALRGDRLEPLRLVEAKRKIPFGPGNSEILRANPFKELADEVASVIDSIAATNGWLIKGIAIDAPAAPPQARKRRSEQALIADGQSVFSTPNETKWREIKSCCASHLRNKRALARLPYANMIWMLYGFELFRSLRANFECEVIEVYPHAIVNAVLQQRSSHKTTKEGYERQQQAVASQTGWTPDALEIALRDAGLGSKHDKLDAFMAAWVASLARNERRVFGTASDPNDAIWVPRIQD